MARNGSGKYDDLCRLVLDRTNGEAVVLIVVENSNASMSLVEDFSVAGSEYHMTRLPKMLRRIADEIEKNGREEKES
jgi:L-arabinose isomerase